MRVPTFVIIVTVGMLASAALAQKPRRFKKVSDGDKIVDKKLWSLQEKLERLQEEEAELEAELEEELEGEIDLEYNPVHEIIDFKALKQTLDNEDSDEEEPMKDPCGEIFCGAGRECLIDENGEGVCQCVERCEGNVDERRKVCSNHNETWPSDCELYRMRCICTEGGEECKNEKYDHVHIDYYGSCQKVQECEKEEMADFPRRMREWLFNIMRDMADRKELSDKFMKIERRVERDTSIAKRWINAAVWKWCELDGHPKDRSISRHELFPLRAPLFTLEHCIAPFLDSCDPDDDHSITLKEWSQCLQLTDELTEDMEELCEDIRD